MYYLPSIFFNTISYAGKQPSFKSTKVGVAYEWEVFQTPPLVYLV